VTPSDGEAALAAFLDQLEREGRPSNTVSAYGRDLRRYFSSLPDVRLTALDRATVSRSLAALAAPTDAPRPSAASVARLTTAIRRFHRFCVATGRSSCDPTAGLSGPSVPRSQPATLTPTEVARLLAAADDPHPLGLRDRALIEVLYGGGLRISEAVGLDRTDTFLDSHEDEVTIVIRGSEGRARTVILPPSAAAALRRYQGSGWPGLTAGRATDAVFLNARGGRLSRQSGWSIVKRSADRAGLVGRVTSPHILRHSRARHLIDDGADLRVVQEMLGHARPASLDVYRR